MGAPSPHHVPLAVILISANVFEIQDCKFMSNVCVCVGAYVQCTHAHKCTQDCVCLCKNVTVEPPLGRLLLLPFELNPS